ncbi:MAG: NUDIX hydrolase [Deltaproteobacteria bacterium]|nr:NUDIX hydrolase [Deltaproteobacteria bacterium]MBN2672404.1 NUDIX hydrolase [Deltaproteobacteria bacterium]
MYQYKYPRPMVCVDVALFGKTDAGQRTVLLIQRGKPPFEGRWALPGGFVEMDEDLQTAAARELAEETQVRVNELLQVGAFGDPKRDPRGRNISVAYTAIIETPLSPYAGDDAKATRVFPLDELPPLAFDHDTIIKSAINTLKLHQKWG